MVATKGDNSDQNAGASQSPVLQGSLWGGEMTENGRDERHAKQSVPPPLKWHGGKHYLADWIISLMPAHEHYLEPFFGGGAVLLRKNHYGVSEIICDKCQVLMNSWACLQSPAAFSIFSRIVEAMPFSEQQYETALARTRALAESDRDYAADPNPELAAAFFVVCRQSMAGRLDTFAPASCSRLRRGMNEQASAWMSCVEFLPEAAARLKRVYMHKPQSAVPLIVKYDKPDMVMYLDPPYLHTVRSAPDVYQHEMTVGDHCELLATVKGLRHARVLLSGYPSDLYEIQLKSWNRATKQIDNKASMKRQKERKVEAVYMNY